MFRVLGFRDFDSASLQVKSLVQLADMIAVVAKLRMSGATKV